MKHHENQHLLPYSYSQTRIQNGRPDIFFHWHPEIEISYVHFGSAQYHIDYDFFQAQPGDIILIRPNGMHSIHPLEKVEHHFETFRFHLDLIGYSTIDQVSLRYLQPLQNSQYKFPPRLQSHMAGYEEIKECLFNIFQLAKKEGRHFELLLKSKVNELLYLLFYHRHVLRKNTDDTYRKNEQIRDIIDYINQHYQDNLSIDFLSEYIGYSKTHFMSVFKQHTGTSCTDFIIQVRLNKACELLVDSDQNILSIATAVGFNNLSNFNRQFKNYHQQTPSQYRKQYRKTRISQTLIHPTEID